MGHDVFISYAAGDRSTADAVCAALERRQMRCWIAPRDARPGLDYADSIVDALDETSVMVFVISSRSIASPHVKREVEHAANTGTQVIPFRIEDVELSRGLRYFLGNVHWIDALTPPIDKQIEYLGDTVQYFLERKGTANAPGQVSPAVSAEPAPPSVVPPSGPASHDAAPPAAQARAPVAAAPIEASLPAPPAPQVVAPDQPASSAATRAAAAPLASAPARTSLPKSDDVPADGPGPRPQSSAIAAPITRPAVDAPSASRPATTNPLWQAVGFGTVGATFGVLLAIGILVAIFGSDSKVFEGAIAFVVMTIVPAAVITWSWLYAIRQRILSPVVMGGMAGMLAGRLSVAVTGFAAETPSPSAFAMAQVLQWAAFGIAGGVVAGLGRGTRPAVSMGIALVCVAFVRSLYLALQPRGEEAFAFLLFDVSIAIGWGIGLIACPATTAALRRPQTAGNTSTAGGAPSHPRA